MVLGAPFLPILGYSDRLLGDKEKAFAWLEKAFQERTLTMVSLKSDQYWDSLRSDPRFAELLRRVGLPQ